MATQLLNTVEITIPRDREFAGVAGLVVGGIAARHDFTLDLLDDLQLALDSLLEYGEEDGGDVTLLLTVGDDALEVSFGPVGERTVAELESDATEALGLRRLLDTTVDDVALTARDGQTWVELRKSYGFAETNG